MKCPKCDYLGFETGDRCKNCGYDFSLMADAPPPDPVEEAPPDRIEIDLDLRVAELPDSSDWLANMEQTPVDAPVLRASDPERAPEPGPVLSMPVEDEKLPLFMPPDGGGDEPLIKLPSAPRPPLAVRRTPDTARLRAVLPRHVDPGPTPPLQFDGEGGAPPEPPTPDTMTPPVVVRRRASRVWAEPGHGRAISAPGRRAAAAAIDHVMLAGIDLAVLYFTLRMAGLPMDEWSDLPAAPFVAFLLLIKVAYFCAFTAVGGQTIGKMAAHIRVVSADDQPVDGALALRRTLAGVLSAAVFGLGFLPALLGTDRRALHDRLAHTRVIALPSA